MYSVAPAEHTRDRQHRATEFQRGCTAPYLCALVDRRSTIIRNLCLLVPDLLAALEAVLQIAPRTRVPRPDIIAGGRQKALAATPL